MGELRRFLCGEGAAGGKRAACCRDLLGFSIAAADPEGTLTKYKREFPRLAFLLLSLPVSPSENLICICIHVCDPDFIVCLFTQALSPTSPPPPSSHLAASWASSCLEYHIPWLFKLSH